MVDMRDNCTRFLEAVLLTPQKLPRWLALGAAFDIKDFTQKCRVFVEAEGNFDAISRCDTAPCIPSAWLALPI